MRKAPDVLGDPPHTPVPVRTGLRYWLPSGSVVEVRRLASAGPQRVADCAYVRQGRPQAWRGSVTLTVPWLERYGRATV